MVILAIVGVLCRWRHRFTIAMLALALVLGATLFFLPLARLLGRLPLTRDIVWTRAAMPLDLALAMLAAVGLEAVRVQGRTMATVGRLAAATLAVGGCLAVIWFGRRQSSLAPAVRATEGHSLLWPLIGVLVVALAAVYLVVGHDPVGRHAATGWTTWPRTFVVCGPTLLAATPNLWDSSST